MIFDLHLLLRPEIIIWADIIWEKLTLGNTNASGSGNDLWASEEKQQDKLIPLEGSSSPTIPLRNLSNLEEVNNYHKLWSLIPPFLSVDHI